jgi:c-di-GMP-binding flagellar brake protein YcgR
MEERRGNKRVTITATAEVTNLEDHSLEKGYVVNVSINGVGLFMKNPLKLNTAVEIKLSFYTLNGIKDVRWITGKIKRVQPFSNVHNVGIQFDSLDPTKHQDLIDYIKEAQKHN